ncbi:MAG: ketopantoate reductase C-terminal domain-containing protein, partial [Myxococcota bacterium]|nr:ketopantoate reductase C-terminal domain-containing protein [Myxococcota bacterium]MEC8425369.1 ketopantoate reductase C-terminal domain-containing protein [Myxococcota bacterium]
ARGRSTEIQDINGEIVRLGAQLGIPTPVNARLVALVRAAETAAVGCPGLSPEALAGP